MDQHQPLGYRFKLCDKEMLKEMLHLLRVRGDIDSISQSAIMEFGSIHALLRQSSDDLKKIKGMTPTVIKRLKTIYSLFRELIKPNEYPASPTRKYEDLSYFLLTAPRFDGTCLRFLYLDENQVILKDFIYKKGAGNQVKFYFREIVRDILRVGISNLVLIHHKMDSSPKPSAQDIERYKKFNKGFAALDLKLVDYLIISENALFSFKDNKLYPAAPMLH